MLHAKFRGGRGYGDKVGGIRGGGGGTGGGGAGSGGRGGREWGYRGREVGIEGAGSLERLGQDIDFFK